MEKYYCEKCDEWVHGNIIKRDETYPIKGESITVNAQVRICNFCEGDCSDSKLDDQTLLAVYDRYREKHGLISPVEVRNLRQKYGLSQRSLAALLGWGEITIHRYEKGGFPDEAHNQMLQLLSDPVNFNSIFTKNRERLPEHIQKRVLSCLSAIDPGESRDLANTFINFETTESLPGILTGFRQFSEENLKNMIFYLASLDGGILKTKLNKLLFYADFIHYRNHSVSISGARYINLPFGPVPDNYEMHLFDLRVEGKIEQLEIPFNDEMTGENLVAIGNFDTSSLPDSAINVLTAVFNHFKEMGSVKISELSHQEDGYKETKKLEPISYEYADKLKVEIEID